MKFLLDDDGLAGAVREPSSEYGRPKTLRDAPKRQLKGASEEERERALELRRPLVAHTRQEVIARIDAGGRVDAKRTLLELRRQDLQKIITAMRLREGCSVAACSYQLGISERCLRNWIAESGCWSEFFDREDFFC